ncbi:MAG: phosphatidylinositol-specific phospholipase C/glycerophosphodiester phosphodiesterase family protein [Verrucomicrobia bacterium]|nr:phosphatidylinositol-specific phospholipase C/glycerophosphodiester phosphodiesterase family protein [Verrucomicrobiota bacterium]
MSALHRWLSRLAACAAAGALGAAERAPSVRPVEPIPLPRAHAHNDYEHARPLLDALDCGFCSVEADVHLVDGKLLVAHDRSNVRPDRTLEALYLKPLAERVRANGGRVHRGGPQFTLLIDFKSAAEPTYAALRPLLAKHKEMLARFTPNGTREGAVIVILSGNRPENALAAEPIRWAAIDGRLPDLERNPPASLVPLISHSWRNVFRWRGQGPIPPAETARLKSLVRRTHQQGRRIRFWAAPDNPAGWEVLYEAGADLINTDDLKGLRRFLLQKRQKQSAK